MNSSEDFDSMTSDDKITFLASRVDELSDYLEKLTEKLERVSYILNRHSHDEAGVAVVVERLQ